MSDTIPISSAKLDELLARNQTLEMLCADAGLYKQRVAQLESIVRTVASLDLGPKGYCSGNLTLLVEQARAALEMGAQPGIGPINPEPQDYKVQCRCGWMGNVSALKSLPEFKMGCPDCNTEFVPLNKMTFPVNRKGEHG